MGLYYIYTKKIYILYNLYNSIMHNKKYTIKESNIHGVGIFAIKDIKKDELIELAFENKLNNNNKLYADIHYSMLKLNHCSIKDNSYLKNINNKYYLYAKNNINIGDEITCNYNNTPDTIRKPNNFKVC